MSLPFGQLLCECGKPYAPSCDGRQLHRRLFDHTPSLMAEVLNTSRIPPLTLSARCQTGAHAACSGVCYPPEMGGRHVCRCACHDIVGEVA